MDQNDQLGDAQLRLQQGAKRRRAGSEGGFSDGDSYDSDDDDGFQMFGFGARDHCPNCDADAPDGSAPL
jgi:hypothetical protein